MKFIDLQQQYGRINEDVRARIDSVLSGGQYILGSEVDELEQILSSRVDKKACVTVSSGTSALLLALIALDIGPGDEVITTPFSFFATVEVIVQAGATPVFADIDPRTYNISPAAIEAAITPRTKAILAVDLYGQCADYVAIERIAHAHGLKIIEDAAQSFGATSNERPACSFGDVSCTSFYPPKPLGCYGDAGACFTDDLALATKIRQLANHGQVSRYNHIYIGQTARCDTIQAAILLAKLTIFDDEVMKRQTVSQTYQKHLKQVPPPYVSPENKSVWAQYTIQVDHRAQFQEQMKAREIPTMVHYPHSFLSLDVLKPHLSPQQRPCPVADHAAETVVSLPFHPYMTEEQVVQVAEAVNQTMLTSVEQHSF